MDIAGMLNNTTEVVRALVALVTGVASVLIGTAFIFSGIRKMIAHAHGHRQGQPTVGPVLINLGIGAVLIQVTFMTDAIVSSMFGSGVENPNAAMQYMPSQVSGDVVLNAMVNAALLWIYAIGFIAVVRGFVQWNSLANGSARDGAGWKGFWHIIFGALAVNIAGTVGLFAS